MPRLSKKKSQPRKVISKKRPRRKTNKKTMKKGYGKKMNKKTMKGGGDRGKLIDDIIGLGFVNLKGEEGKELLRSITGCAKTNFFRKNPDKKRCKDFLTGLKEFLSNILEHADMFRNQLQGNLMNELLEEAQELNKDTFKNNLKFDDIKTINLEDIKTANESLRSLPNKRMNISYVLHFSTNGQIPLKLNDVINSIITEHEEINRQIKCKECKECTYLPAFESPSISYKPVVIPKGINDTCEKTGDNLVQGEEGLSYILTKDDDSLCNKLECKDFTPTTSEA